MITPWTAGPGEEGAVRIVVTTCGTSILTNTSGDEDRRALIAHANRTEEEVGNLPEGERLRLNRAVARATSRLASAGPKDVRRLSAELNGLLARFPDPRQGGTHLLVTTDTWLGRKAAGLVREWLERRGCGVQEVIAPGGLSLRSPEDLRFGLTALVWQLDGWLGEGGWTEILFNLSGGFKAINGFLQAYAMLRGGEVFYIFERTDRCVSIPRMPITVDHALFAEQVEVFRALALGLPVPAAEPRRRRLPEALWVEVDGGAMLTEWGELLWRRARETLYRKALQPPPFGSRITYARRLADRIGELDVNALHAFNRRVDQLARCLARGVNLQGLDFKPLAGDPRPPATHEFDVTHTHGALRGFGHFEHDTFVIEDVDWHD